jgi:hypothetical protein
MPVVAALRSNNNNVGRLFLKKAPFYFAGGNRSGDFRIDNSSVNNVICVDIASPSTGRCNLENKEKRTDCCCHVFL